MLRADLVQDAGIAEICGRRVLAFAGIGFPEKFFAGLERAGVIVAGRVAFADHHGYTEAELAGLVRKAREIDAILVTTPKDAVRLPAGAIVHVVNVRLAWANAAAIEQVLGDLIATGRERY